jgi:hypothetical protein
MLTFLFLCWVVGQVVGRYKSEVSSQHNEKVWKACLNQEEQ